ncbi:MAG: zinc ribbon domain-containing protein [Planctomycetaceae bacterium]|nr:zinc ribbon domain-containing protein [Planctomycetaceae bacterium]
MPLFEFVCENCNAQFELLLSRNERAECPACHSKNVDKLMSSSAGRVGSSAALPIAGACPPPSHGPCGPGCCRLPS